MSSPLVQSSVKKPMPKKPTGDVGPFVATAKNGTIDRHLEKIGFPFDKTKRYAVGQRPLWFLLYSTHWAFDPPFRALSLPRLFQHEQTSVRSSLCLERRIIGFLTPVPDQCRVVTL
jgi:hypothetical protein